jgi:hypothetical protein
MTEIDERRVFLSATIAKLRNQSRATKSPRQMSDMLAEANKSWNEKQKAENP